MLATNKLDFSHRRWRKHKAAGVKRVVMFDDRSSCRTQRQRIRQGRRRPYSRALPSFRYLSPRLRTGLYAVIRYADLMRATTHSAFLVLALILTFSFGCGPSSQGGGQDSPGSPSQGPPELTKEIIDQRINDARVYEVLPERGTGDPISWGFDEDEPKEIVVVDQKIDGPRASVILEIKTQSSPRANNLRYLAGQLRTEWELETGWVLRRWEIVRTENISMKYRDLPKPAPQNSNR